MALGTAAMVALAAASGNFQPPVVAGDARAALSANGSTAVLIEAPADGRSRLAVVDLRKRELERVITLRGNYSFDAISPNGRRLYVIRFLSGDHRRYAIQTMRTSDPPAALETVVEKGEPGEKMSGLPLSRAASDDGSWVYTLYDGNGSEPFIHALQTTDRYTVCIDLQPLAGRTDLAAMKLKLEPRGLVVSRAGSPLAIVDTGSFEVRAIKAPHPRKTQNAGNKSASRSPATIALIAGALLLAAIAAAGRAFRRKSAPGEGYGVMKSHDFWR